MGYVTQSIRRRWHFVAKKIGLPLALVTWITVSAQAAAPPAAASLGLNLTNVNGHLTVAAASAPLGTLVLRTGDVIVAVNGHWVASEAAFVNLLTQAKGSGHGVNITLVRNGTSQVVSAVPPSRSLPNRSGFLNPDLIVMTSQGAMHRDAAARRGLPVTTPITGTPERSTGGIFPFVNAVPPSRSLPSLPVVSGGFGFLNPDLLVMTSQGVMHRDTAARLGLPGTPITGSRGPDSSGSVTVNN
jgi:ribosomal protein S8